MPGINLEDTIAAIATPQGEGGLSVIRVSGDQAIEIADKVFSSKSGKKVSQFVSHTIHYGEIRKKGVILLDQALLSVFKAPQSYTGEDVVEISAHGGTGVCNHMLDLLFKSGARPAEPGEFTKRAFLNGKIDLTQAEAVIDLIKAKSERSLELAARQLAGSLSARFKHIKSELMQIYAHLEAFVDFPDEDIEVYSDKEFGTRFLTLLEDIHKLCAGFKRGALIREGVNAVIVGRPNAGKSSLFNALLERDHALVSEFPGTTRDRLEETIEIDGVLIRITDTAGLGLLSQNPLDHIGMERTRETLGQAQLVLFIMDSSGALSDEDRAAFREIDSQKPFLVVLNKCDLDNRMNTELLSEMTGTRDFISISAKTRFGFDQLEAKIADTVLEGRLEHDGEQITRLRHKKSLESAYNALSRASEAFRDKKPIELVSIDVKAAIDELSELVGEIYSENLLDVIFSEFCIGK